MRFKKCTRSERDDYRKSVFHPAARADERKWAEVFQNDHPIHIEVGMGKGQFIIEMARRNPEVKLYWNRKIFKCLSKSCREIRRF